MTQDQHPSTNGEDALLENGVFYVAWEIPSDLEDTAHLEEYLYDQLIEEFALNGSFETVLLSEEEVLEFQNTFAEFRVIDL